MMLTLARAFLVARGTSFAGSDSKYGASFRDPLQIVIGDRVGRDFSVFFFSAVTFRCI
ncbi:hypothetical protein SOVF_076940 [Spinacia oleracea]|nr:hypothetical protein SOVF_076940 [Spinacia oleracea]